MSRYFWSGFGSDWISTLEKELGNSVKLLGDIIRPAFEPKMFQKSRFITLEQLLLWNFQGLRLWIMIFWTFLRRILPDLVQSPWAWRNSPVIFLRLYSGVQSKNNVYHIVDKVQNSYENTLKFDLIDNVVYVVFALYSSILAKNNYSYPQKFNKTRVPKISQLIYR